MNRSAWEDFRDFVIKPVAIIVIASIVAMVFVKVLISL